MLGVSFAGCLSTLLLFLPIGYGADFFRWTDEKGVVHFTDNPHNIPEKFRARALRIKGKEPEKAQETARAPLSRVSVPFHKRGEVVIIPATVNEQARVNFVVDTGASYSLISRAVAQNLHIDLQEQHPRVRLQTANGVIEAPLVTLVSIDVGGMLVKDLPAAVHDIFPDPNVSGLLGLNFLTHFRMDIDTKTNVLVLEKK
jgi:clan AA aspartic protease (TIGR02281 family)